MSRSDRPEGEPGQPAPLTDGAAPLIDLAPSPNAPLVPLPSRARALDRARARVKAAATALARLSARVPLPTALRYRLDAGGLAVGATLSRELDRRAALPWIAVAFALGAALYLALPAEPVAEVLAVVALGCLLGALYRRRRGSHGFGLALSSALFAGLASGAIETRLADAPRLDRQRTVQLTGDIEVLEPTARGTRRLTLAVVALPGVPDAHTPRRVTVTVASKEPALSVGDRVALSARIAPPRGPVMPDGYDFARGRFFDRVGASGFTLGKPTVIPFEPGPARALRAGIDDARHALADRIRAALPGDAGAIAVALIVGIESGVSPQAAEALRASGLYHILSISGLHMTLVAGLVLFGLRFGLALIPAVALRLSTKALAAGAALLITFLYLLMSGAEVPAVRAWIMIAVALIAVLARRRALTQRAVAIAALAILALSPSAVAEPGFQMSFLAVIALVAAWEAKTGPEAERARAARPPSGPVGKAATLLRDAALASLVAGLATAPVVADVFYRAAPYSVFANVATTPITGLLVMPAALGAMLALPFGLDGPILALMGLGIDAMIAIAETVAAWPGGDGLIGRIHPLTAPLAIGGLLWLALWHERWRFLGLVPIAVAVVIAPFATRPDLLVTDTGRLVAARGADGVLVFSGVKADRFATGVWLAADADRRAVRALEGPTGGFQCDPLGCVAAIRRTMADPSAAARPYVIAHVTDANAFEEDCRRADLVITPLVAPARCRLHATVIDARVLSVTGALAITLSSTSQAPRAPLSVTFALPKSPRPWTPTPWLAIRDTPPADPALPALLAQDPATWGPVSARTGATNPASSPLDPTEPPDTGEEPLDEDDGDGAR